MWLQSKTPSSWKEPDFAWLFTHSFIKESSWHNITPLHICQKLNSNCSHIFNTFQFRSFFYCWCCWWWLKGSRIGASLREVHFLQDSPLIPNSNKRMKTKFKLIMMIIRVVIITMSAESMEVTIVNMMLIGYYSGVYGNSMRFQVAGVESLGRWR